MTEWFRVLGDLMDAAERGELSAEDAAKAMNFRRAENDLALALAALRSDLRKVLD